MSEHRIIIEPSREILPIEEAAAALRTAVLAYSAKGGRDTGIVTFKQPVVPIDPAAWLAAQERHPRILWINRDRDFAVAGTGTADAITFEGRTPNPESFTRLEEELASRPHEERYFGGMHFNNAEHQDSIWEGFPSCAFILPEIELTLEKGRHTLACRLAASRPEEVPCLAAGLAAKLGKAGTVISKAGPAPELQAISYSPGHDAWGSACRTAIASFESGSMDKIMLARRTTLEFATPIKPATFLFGYPHPENATYRFCYEPENGAAFISFTPERLYCRNGRELLTEALAGTCAKELVGGGEQGASRSLLGSEKDIREHRFVKEMISEELSPICSHIDMDEEAGVLQLNHLAHLYTKCRAKLRESCSQDSRILSILHPTPAVGGVPKEDAMRQIIELEPFSRGWYAAPVGWISRGAAEFAVGIRSALIRGNKAHLFSGAGLVLGSDPDSEWTEVEQKIGDLMSIARRKA